MAPATGGAKGASARLRVAAVPAAARETRHWAVGFVREHGARASAARTVELLVSEVVTNAVKYGAVADAIAISLRCADGAVTVRVTDDSTVRPVVRKARPSDLGGRGMELVERLAEDWGVDVDARRGKTVWFRVSLR
ncbi:ATP-binding protein [Cellulomonas cellasea]|uniref:Anti-sigma regulatory factor (Ser/Thr protein kinase) n=1 Tax=Cellulomonas cellasea TaxID=43670 RepID=A0A7W4YBY6_9CELL|nr:ATP-binding protein [Cellulomonas cellasea]MBB2923559.1 anti-sigma regulatory factor (Ser/Thr protein kinase) [Cellulomonas cellasea]